MRRSPLRVIAAVLGTGLLALLAWAFLWPDPVCTKPACAEARFRVFIELDSLGGAEPVPLEVTVENRRLTVQELLAGGGVVLDIRRDETRLPYDDSAGPLDQADLLAYFHTWSNQPLPPGSDAKVYALATPTLRSDSGQLVFGMLFDLGAREGIAVAPGVVRRLFRRHNPDQVPLLQMRTFAHELLHALNRYHADAAVSADGRFTVEAPTNCMALVSPGEWRLTEQPLWALSPATIGFFQSADPREVLPGTGANPFVFRRDSVRDCQLARQNPLEPAHPRLTLALERLLSLVPDARAQGAAGLDGAGDPAGDAVGDAADDAAADSANGPEPGPLPALDLALEGQAAAYPLGYPVVIRVHARNEGEVALPLVNRLAPAYGSLVLETRLAGEEDWQPFHPLVSLEPVSDERALLAPGATTTQSVEIAFGEGGWTFPAPGRYEVRARVILDEAAEIAVSPALTITVEAPRSRADAAALALLQDGSGALDPAVGRFLSFRGRIPGDTAGERIRRLVREYPDTALAAAFRFSLAAALLRPAIDPVTGRRAPADTATARRLLDEACRDSGIAALGRRAWLNQTDPDRAQDPAVLAALEAVAWEGREEGAASGGLVYGDGNLKPAAPPIVFGLGGTELWEAGAREVRRVARQLRRAGVRQVLVAGHADGTGRCADNDIVALRRARAVAAELVRGGLPRKAITVTGLGARRPADFSTTPEGATRNRRVEILIPGNTAGT